MKFKNNDTHSSTGIAYLYCDYRRKYEQTLEQLLANLLKQLAQGLPHIPKDVQALYSEYKSQPKRPTLDHITKALYSATMAYSNVFIIVDALDECQVQDGCRQQLLAAILKLQDECRANIFVTSRDSPEILEAFEKHTRITAKDEDVQTYLSGQMAGLPSFVRRNLALQSEIKETIAKFVDGMYVQVAYFKRQRG
jgi:nitrate/nitrite-specific signal transduction histidine kinase